MSATARQSSSAKTLRDDQGVITGVGVIAPTGFGTRKHWETTLAGHSAIRRITRFDPSVYPCHLAGEAADFAAGEHLPTRLITQTDRMTHMALVAADLALADARIELSQINEFEMAVITANSSGGFEFGQDELKRLWTKGPRSVSAYLSIAWFYAASTGQLSIRHGLRGPCGVVATDQSGGLDAVGAASRVLADGVKMVITGGTDASLCPWGFVTQIPGDRLSRERDPSRAYLPFDEHANGYVPGEGGAILIVERADHARDRGAPGYGAVLGHASTFDPPPWSGRPPRLADAIRQALENGGVEAGEVDAVFADAAGIPEADAVEADALREVFGPRQVPVCAPKAMTGRLYAGAGALDIATALMAIRDDTLPTTGASIRPAAGQEIDLVTGQPRQLPVSTVLVIGRGYGGFNSALLLRGM
jgi:minimal PKS chain-length factor (CLF/KS beta)